MTDVSGLPVTRAWLDPLCEQQPCRPGEAFPSVPVRIDTQHAPSQRRGHVGKDPHGQHQDAEGLGIHGVVETARRLFPGQQRGKEAAQPRREAIDEDFVDRPARQQRFPQQERQQVGVLGAHAVDQLQERLRGGPAVGGDGLERRGQRLQGAFEDGFE